MPTTSRGSSRSSIKGGARPALLDTYDAERRPVAERLLRTTDRAFQLVVGEGGFARLFRTRILARVAARAMTLERVRRLAFRTLSQIGIRYPGSPLSQTVSGLPQGAPLAGERFPWLQLRMSAGSEPVDLFERLDDTHFNLLVIGQPAPPAQALGVGDLVLVHDAAGRSCQCSRTRPRRHPAPVVLPAASRWLHRPRREPPRGRDGEAIPRTALVEQLQLSKGAPVVAASRRFFSPTVPRRPILFCKSASATGKMPACFLIWTVFPLGRVFPCP